MRTMNENGNTHTFRELCEKIIRIQSWKKQYWRRFWWLQLGSRERAHANCSSFSIWSPTRTTRFNDNGKSRYEGSWEVGKWSAKPISSEVGCRERSSTVGERHSEAQFILDFGVCTMKQALWGRTCTKRKDKNEWANRFCFIARYIYFIIIFCNSPKEFVCSIVELTNSWFVCSFDSFIRLCVRCDGFSWRIRTEWQLSPSILGSGFANKATPQTIWLWPAPYAWTRGRLVAVDWSTLIGFLNWAWALFSLRVGIFVLPTSPFKGLGSRLQDWYG